MVDSDQGEKFRQAARALEAEDNEAAFDAKLKALAKPKPLATSKITK